MLVTLTIIRYPKRYIPFALLAMAVHRFPLWANKKISFYKLMGCGKNASFDKNPDWQQWAILTVRSSETAKADTSDKDLLNYLYGYFIGKWLHFFHCETWTIFLEPIEGHGKWDGKEPFGILPGQNVYTGPVAVLTRASIRLSRLKSFWSNVDAVAAQLPIAKGLISSFGIGEMPYIKQATFSIWESIDAMKQFAYQTHQHTAVIHKTKKEKWYSEELFVRFIPVKTFGSIKGNDPLAGKL